MATQGLIAVYEATKALTEIKFNKAKRKHSDEAKFKSSEPKSLHVEKLAHEKKIFM